jgi:hypothetical protein
MYMYVCTRRKKYHTAAQELSNNVTSTSNKKSFFVNVLDLSLSLSLSLSPSLSLSLSEQYW